MNAAAAAGTPARPSRFSRFRNATGRAMTGARSFAGRASVGAASAYATAKVAAQDPKYYIIAAVVFLTIAAGVLFFGFKDESMDDKTRGDRKVVVTFFLVSGLMLLVIAYLTRKCIAVPGA